MKLLFVTPQLPWPPLQGTALRNYHLLQAAAGQHEVDLLSFGSAGDAEVLTPLRELCRRIAIVPPPHRPPLRRLGDLAAGWADMERRLWSPAFARRLAAMLADGGYDLVQLEGFEIAGYLLGPVALRAETAGQPPWPAATEGSARAPWIVFDDHNAEYRLQQSAAAIDGQTPGRWPRALYSALQARRLRRREALYAAAADLCLAVSEEDAAALEALVPNLGAVVVPNGVDCAAMPPAIPAVQPTLFFAGKLDYRPNVDACEWLVRDIVPRVQARFPEARVVLAGRDPSPAVRRLAGPSVEVTGLLDEAELARRRAAAWVYVVPMRMGSGVRFKVLEAMAAGIPLVTTPLGAAGAAVEDGRHALIAGSAEAFAAAVVRLLEDDHQRHALACAARELAEQRHDWRQITPRLLAAYGSLGQRPRQRTSAIATLLNERSTVEPLLRSLAGQSRPPDEVVIVDGGSTDGTWKFVCGAAAGGLPIQVRAERALGTNIAQGRNRAIEAASHDLIAATDGGVVLHSRWLERLIAPFERQPALAAASGFFVAAPQTTWERALGATTLPAVEDVDPARFLPSSRSFALRRGMWRQAGGYPEWLDYGEDLFLDLALLRLGVRPRFVPRAVVYFRPRPSPAAFFRQYYRYARGDGKAGFWPRRHAIRYSAYLGGGWLLWRALASPPDRLPALALLAAGAIGYLRRPLIRLTHVTRTPDEYLRAAALVPLVRLVGDVAKMCGYPVGVLWRLRRAFRLWS